MSNSIQEVSKCVQEIKELFSTKNQVVDKIQGRELDKKLENLLFLLVSAVREEYRADIIGNLSVALQPFFQGVLEKMIPPTISPVPMVPRFPVDGKVSGNYFGASKEK